MVEIKDVIFTEKFKSEVKKTRDQNIKTKVKKQITKIIDNPEIGKSLRHDLKGQRTVYVKPYRLVYSIINRLWDKINQLASYCAKFPYTISRCLSFLPFSAILSIRTFFCQQKIRFQNCFFGSIQTDRKICLQ